MQRESPTAGNRFSHAVILPSAAVCLRRPPGAAGLRGSTSGGMLAAMSRSLLPKLVEQYVSFDITRETPIQKRLRVETARLPQGGMQIGPDQGALLALLVRAIGAKRAVEIGTFTGYSALAVASALPADGKLFCCDKSEEWTAIARRHWKKAGLDQRIELRLGLARETLQALATEYGPGSFDFAFIDADKSAYDAYYEACLALLRPGGIIALDNMLWSGEVANRAVRDADTVALRTLNARIRDDARVDSCLLTVGDGVMLALKR
jgi:predicted O-methyltransferase YrrM